MLLRYKNAEALEQFLGDPANPNNIFSFRHVMQLDEQDLYPDELCKALSAFKFHHFFVPQKLGGKFTSFEELNALIRVVSRRDITVAWSHSLNTYIGAVNVLLTGSDVQKIELANMILAGRKMAAGYHEKDHGSDLLASEVEATPIEEGFHLSGTKWVIGNATLGNLILVFARTSPLGGERGFSLFLVNKDELPVKFYSHLPKVKTHGIRGADISGIKFNNAPLTQSNMIGKEGGALESTMRSFQITRTLVSGLSLGAADTSLRITLEFMLSRNLYERSLLNLPQCQSQLLNAFIDLIICDCVSLAGARGLHFVPEQMSVWSSIIKYFVPSTVDDIIQNLSVLLGARHYLREEHCSGIFQKIWRDHSVASIGHVPSFLNLAIISQNLAKILKMRAQATSCEISPDPDDNLQEQRLNAVFSLTHPLPAFDENRLLLFNKGREDVTSGIKSAIELIAFYKKDQRIFELANILHEELDFFAENFFHLSDACGRDFHQSPEAFELAKRFCIIFAAAACLHLWVRNHQKTSAFFPKSHWILMCLERLIGKMRPLKVDISKDEISEVFEELIRLFQKGESFSVRYFS